MIIMMVMIMMVTNDNEDDTGDDALMGMMKIGNNVLRAGIEPRSLAFQASVETITQHGLP